MTNQASKNWLEPFRQQHNHTQESLTNALNISVRTLSRWENYGTMNNIPYDRLAEALNTDEQTLKDAHQQGINQHINQLAQQKPINKKLIIKALEDCQTMGLTGEVLNELNVNTIEEAADKIVVWLTQGDMQPFIKHINKLIKAAIDVVDFNTINDLVLIEQLVGHIALSATIIAPEQLDENQTFILLGVKQAWSIRLMIDASIGFSMTGITALSSTDLKGVGGVKIEEGTKDKVWQAAHEIIKNLVDELFMEKETFPELVESEGHQELPEEDQYPDFRQYCSKRINRAIEQTNYEQKHCFLYSLQQEPEEVQQRVVMLLDSIRVFICSNNHSGAPVLRVDEDKLEAWIANALYAIQSRREQLKPLEVSKMKTKDNTATSIYVEGGNGGVNLATNGSSITQITQSPESEQLIALLNDILKETDRSIPEHQQLRGDVNDILNPLIKKEMPPEQGKAWLQDGLNKLKSVANLKTGTGLITLIEKAIGLYEKF